MSRTPENPLELLKGMSRIVTPAASDEFEPERRQKIARRIDMLLDGLRARDRGRRTRRLWALGAAAAVTLLVGVGAYRGALTAPEKPGTATIRELSGDVTLVRAGQSSSASSARDGVLGAADELRTAKAASAKLLLESQALVDVAGGTTLRLGRAEHAHDARAEHIVLSLGRIALDVPSLAGGKLSVETPDALVTVRGTQFAVDVQSSPAGGTVTRVSVVLGEVEVQSRGVKALLGSGAQWSSLAKPNPSPRHEPVEGTPAPAESPTPARSMPAPAKSAPSTLAEENRLYESALSDARRGNSAAALAGLERLVNAFPSSPLVQNARVERFRILRRAGHQAAAAREARLYLSAYPSGFAREEAARIVSEQQVEPRP